ncbi:MAG TPA: hypothetical protein VJI98_01710 [Candidatus Nanoarchaeia archaeon]|nr:hypothetical protein [Candidatus Nanoarchaeia archaeon]
MKLMITVLIFVVLLIAGCSSKATPEELEFATCLSDNDAIMFGAYWCPHCQEQKRQFGGAWENINYIECSLPNGQGQTEVCNLAKIESYPTWEFKDGSRLVGVQSFGQLAAKTDCKLP